MLWRPIPRRQAGPGPRGLWGRASARVGQLADQAGLFALDDATLAVLFRSLAILTDSPTPCSVLDGLLHDALRVSVAAVDGSAEADASCGP
jgi:hypothetical protein